MIPSMADCALLLGRETSLGDKNLFLFRQIYLMGIAIRRGGKWAGADGVRSRAGRIWVGAQGPGRRVNHGRLLFSLTSTCKDHVRSRKRSQSPRSRYLYSNHHSISHFPALRTDRTRVRISVFLSVLSPHPHLWSWLLLFAVLPKSTSWMDAWSMQTSIRALLGIHSGWPTIHPEPCQ
jgi:hypothetical protein